MAESLITALSGAFDPTAYTDSYREAVQSLIDAKVEGREVVAPPTEDGDDGSVVDLMAALRASVEAAKKARGEPTKGKKSVTESDDSGPASAVDTPTGGKRRSRRAS